VRRVTIVLLSSQGYSTRDIRAATEVCIATVTNIRNRWLKEGESGLEDKSRDGRPPVADADYVVDLLGLVNSTPDRYGYSFSVWTAGRMAEHMARKTGKRVSGQRVALLLRGCGYACGRPKHTLRGKRDERAWERAAIGCGFSKRGSTPQRRLRALLPRRGALQSPPVSGSLLETSR
jgi:transposase